MARKANPKQKHFTDVEHRRTQVARLALRGLSLREIAIGLAALKPPIVNPDTGEPYTHTTIDNDLKAIRKKWQKEAATDYDQYRAKHLAEIAEIKRMAWANSDPELALKALEKEMRVVGTLRTTLHIDVSFDLIERLVRAIKNAGLTPAEMFEEMIKELAAEDATE